MFTSTASASLWVQTCSQDGSGVDDAEGEEEEEEEEEEENGCLDLLLLLQLLLLLLLLRESLEILVADPACPIIRGKVIIFVQWASDVSISRYRNKNRPSVTA